MLPQAASAGFPYFSRHMRSGGEVLIPKARHNNFLFSKRGGSSTSEDILIVDTMRSTPRVDCWILIRITITMYIYDYRVVDEGIGSGLCGFNALGWRCCCSLRRSAQIWATPASAASLILCKWSHSAQSLATCSPKDGCKSFKVF